jgi:hypothetical protein
VALPPDFITEEADVGYFEALTSSSFKTTPDGRRLFFPWGPLGRGYVIASEQDYERLRQQIKTFLVVGLVAIIGFSVLQIYVAASIVTAFLMGFYLLWMRSLLSRLQRSDERLSLQESMTTQARLHSGAVLWLLEIASLVFVGGGVLILIATPADWLIALAAIVFFGLCAVAVGRMLVLRRQVGSPSQGAR